VAGPVFKTGCRLSRGTEGSTPSLLRHPLPGFPPFPRAAICEGMPETDSDTLRAALLRRFSHRIVASGELVFPAVPALVDHYLAILERMADALGRPFSDGRENLRQLLREKLEWAFRRSSSSTVHVRYATSEPPNLGVDWTVSPHEVTLEDQYRDWPRTHEPPLFGAHPDARLMDVAHGLGAPESITCLDVGAGTGRNTLALAREGFPTDAVEPSAALADQLEAAIRHEGLSSRVIRADFLASRLDLPRTRYRVVVLSGVCPHFRDVEMLAHMFRRVAGVLEPGGVALLNVFLAVDGYTPDPAVEQVSGVAWSRAFTRADLARAVTGLPLTLVSDEKVLAYERARLPKWPPTGWYEGWSSGGDIFGLAEGESPIALRWLTYRRDA
jgi:SAM-dependent methyltransferase